MFLPVDQRLDISLLAQIFNNTVATYKFYWFVSLLDFVVTGQRRRLSLWELIIGMIAEAWYPIHYFRLSFGKADSLYKQIVDLQVLLNIPIDAEKSEIKRQLANDLRLAEVRRLLRIFTLNVPYRFLSPWIPYKSDRQVTEMSQKFSNNCLYAITDDFIEINPLWLDYLQENYLILRDFSFWNLALFLQKRNPNVPDVLSKLIKPIQRESLQKQRRFWDSYIESRGTIKCIYTGRELAKKHYDLDHFIPWSYVSHDLLWNLLPADSSINSAKSNNLPVLKDFLQPFARMHWHALRTIYPKNPNNKLLEDYLNIHSSLSELVEMPEPEFQNIFQKTFLPMAQIAENMGFKYWHQQAK